MADNLCLGDRLPVLAVSWKALAHDNLLMSAPWAWLARMRPQMSVQGMSHPSTRRTDDDGVQGSVRWDRYSEAAQRGGGGRSRPGLGSKSFCIWTHIELLRPSRTMLRM
jgi:hypothetical protein